MKHQNCKRLGKRICQYAYTERNFSLRYKARVGRLRGGTLTTLAFGGSEQNSLLKQVGGIERWYAHKMDIMHFASI
jgi:hypothetical protein